MNLIVNKKIAIVGGGPGGLTLARLLQMNGADVKVYERDINKDARVQGATLDLHEESGLKALEEAGLMSAFEENYRPGADRMCITDKKANILYEDNADEEDKRSRPEIDRGPLQNILLDSLQPHTVVWDSHFVSLFPQGNSWKLEFKNGQTAFADIVIAADGANSKIRPYLTPIKPFYAGVTVIEGAVYNSETASPKVHKLLNGGKIFAMGDEKTLIVSSKGDGSLVFYTGCKTDENWSKNIGIDFSHKKQVLAWFKKEYSGWDNIWDELFENAASKFVPRPQYCMPFDQTWEALPNLTI
ncbi:FAD-dependent oxidoreductase [Pedobacter sp. NJ-S-72]